MASRDPCYASQSPCSKPELEGAEKNALPRMLMTGLDFEENEDCSENSFISPSSSPDNFPFAIYPRCEELIRQERVPPLEEYPLIPSVGKGRFTRSVLDSASGSSKQTLSGIPAEGQMGSKMVTDKVRMQPVVESEQTKEDATSEEEGPMKKASRWNQLQEYFSRLNISKARAKRAPNRTVTEA